MSSRRILTPRGGASRKRKVPEASNFSPTSSKSTVPETVASMGPQSCNRLLAGYMAFEFLDKGTLLGCKFDPEGNRSKSGSGSGSGSEPQCYGDVSKLLRIEGGGNIPGVVNPTQLARWLQM